MLKSLSVSFSASNNQIQPKYFFNGETLAASWKSRIQWISCHNNKCAAKQYLHIILLKFAWTNILIPIISINVNIIQFHPNKVQNCGICGISFTTQYQSSKKTTKNTSKQLVKWQIKSKTNRYFYVFTKLKNMTCCDCGYRWCIVTIYCFLDIDACTVGMALCLFCFTTIIFWFYIFNKYIFHL